MNGPIITSGDAFVSRYTLKPDRRDEFVKLFNARWRPMAEEIQKATNFVFYGWGRCEYEFVAIESWKDPAVVAKVRESDSFKMAVARYLECCKKSMTMELFSGMDGGRSVFDTFAQGLSKVHPHAGDIGVIFL
jgi:hypothetical protein